MFLIRICSMLMVCVPCVVVSEYFCTVVILTGNTHILLGHVATCNISQQLHEQNYFDRAPLIIQCFSQRGIHFNRLIDEL